MGQATTHRITPKFLEYLNDALASKGWSRAEFCRRVDLNQATVSKYFSGVIKEIRDDTLNDMGRVLGVDRDMIMIPLRDKGDEPECVVRGRMAGYADQIDRFSEWLRNQPHEIKEPILKLAEAYGWKR
jgi:transcriptional regulator with XRE-family HTH domain